MLHWKDLRINVKMYAGFGFVILLLTAIAVWSIFGITKIVYNAEEVIAGNKLDGLLAQKEVDHLNWAGDINALLTDSTITELNVQMDDHQCAFGQWLYGEERKEAEALIPSLAPLLKEIEEPHKHLHDSAAEIKSVFRQADAMLPAILTTREIEHLNWADEIRDTLLSGRTILSVQTDPEKCNLGVWLKSDAARQIYRKSSKGFQAEWDAMLTVHEQLHQSAVGLGGQLRQSSARGLSFFNNTTLPLLDETINHLEKLSAIAEKDLLQMNQASVIYSGETQPSLVEVQSLLNQVRNEVRINLMTDQQMIQAAIATRKGVITISIIAFFMGILLALVIARGYYRSNDERDRLCGNPFPGGSDSRDRPEPER